LLLITARTLQWKKEKAIVEVLFDVGMEYGVIFSPLLVSSQEWNMERRLKNWTDYRFYNFQEFFKKGIGTKK
jgi:hypothetical protein